MHSLRPAAALLLVACCLGAACAYTDPGEVQKLWALRTELLSRGLGPQLSSWTCPQGLSACNPCGRRNGADDAWGKDGGGWEHIACRTYDMNGQEFRGIWRNDMNISRMGVVTNIHLTDLKIEGSLESLGRALCPLSHLRELDLDGGHLTGTIPRWIADCFPHLKELDLSFNRLSGSLPDWLPVIGGHLLQLKVQQNELSGAIPRGIGASMPNLRVFWAHHNQLSGVLPADLASSQSLISLDVRSNPKLCGQLPPGLRTMTVPADWRGFCEKAFTEDNTACNLMLTPGTALGQQCL